MPPASLPWCRFTKRAFAVRHGTDGALQLTGYGAGAAHSAARGAAHSAQPQRTFREYNLHLEREQPEAHRIWILKPLGGFNQIGDSEARLLTGYLAKLSCPFKETVTSYEPIIGRGAPHEVELSWRVANLVSCARSLLRRLRSCMRLRSISRFCERIAAEMSALSLESRSWRACISPVSAAGVGRRRCRQARAGPARRSKQTTCTFFLILPFSGDFSSF